MKREVKFRGKRVDNGAWIYGSYHPHRNVALCIASKEEAEQNNRALIIQDGMADWNLSVPVHSFEVIPDSVGEWTGLFDKEKKAIYEDDIVLYEDHEWRVLFDYDRWNMVNGEKAVRDDDFSDDPGFTSWELCKVMGNVFDNPELLNQ